MTHMWGEGDGTGPGGHTLPPRGWEGLAGGVVGGLRLRAPFHPFLPSRVSSVVTRWLSPLSSESQLRNELVGRGFGGWGSSEETEQWCRVGGRAGSLQAGYSQGHQSQNDTQKPSGWAMPQDGADDCWDRVQKSFLKQPLSLRLLFQE